MKKRLGREGLYLSRIIKRGETIKSADLLSKKTAIGIRSRYKNTIIGSKAIKNLSKDDALHFEDIDI